MRFTENEGECVLPLSSSSSFWAPCDASGAAAAMAVSGHAVPPAADKRLVITDNSSFPEPTGQERGDKIKEAAKGGSVCLHNIDWLD